MEDKILSVLLGPASACVECGQCETRCPFRVKIVEHMRKAGELFGE